jgi:N utilization substance protein B
LRKRRKSREFALQVLFQLEITKQDSVKAFTQSKEHFLKEAENDEFAEQIVLGVREHFQQIDRLIERYSENWRLDRISLIDRNILRMAIFELLYCEEIPPKVTLNEAIDLGKRFGTDDSGSFINGILDRIQNECVRKPI